MAASTEWVGFH